MLESLGSSRIEGNRTTLADLIDARLGQDTRASAEERLREIENLERAMDFIDNTIDEEDQITRAHISEMHKITVRDLELEGDQRPGEYRNHAVEIAQSQHVPPDHTTLPSYMEELLRFINQQREPKLRLIVCALVHHRFAWVHPFGNGNGRVVRLLTYAMLIQQGFRVRAGRVLNPTAVFCVNRQEYYDMLASADQGTDENLLRWVRYVLTGLNREMEKIDRLLDANYLQSNVLLPAIDGLRQAEHINDQERNILSTVAEKQVARAGDVKHLVSGPRSRVSEAIKHLRDRRLLTAIEGKKQIYRISFTNNVLMRAVIEQLQRADFVPNFD